MDLKKLPVERLRELAEELRETIIDRVSKNGGHLASNLGIVEIAIALHYVFDSPRDKMLWDVGHQCYAHKLLTGRQKDFHTLRKHGGLSGFPKRSESPHDIFGTGHSSTSISASLGMAVARDLTNSQIREGMAHGKVIAVIGDGAMTSGLAFEGLNHAGHLRRDLIVILNDNEMSISPNVGALSNYLSRIQTGAFFKKIKRETKALLEGIPRIGGKVSKIAERAEGSLKGFFLPGGLFLDLGFNYLGPIDGHDLPLLIETLRGLTDVTEPTLVHVVTTKGKGYKFSEEDPCVYHGIGPFDTCEGIKNGSAVGESQTISCSDIFGKSLLELAMKDNRIIAITAAMKEGTGLSEFASTLPERFYDVGIAEPHAVTFAAGIATMGLRPVVAIYSTFLQRGYDEIIHDVCLQELPVVFAIDRAGIVGEDGPTHQGLFDIAYLRHIPNLIFMAPKDGDELKAMLAFALRLSRPCAIRFPRGMWVVNNTSMPEGAITLGKGELISEGDEVLIIAIGNTVARAMRALERLRNDGIGAALINARFIKPLDKESILSMTSKIKRVITVEEHCLAGGFGSSVLECISDAGLQGVQVKRLGIGDFFVEHGSQAVLRAKYGIDEEAIYRAAYDLIKV